MRCVRSTENWYISPPFYLSAIGVFTKADLIQPEEWKPWLDMLRNSRFYVTRQLTTKQVLKGKMTLEQGRLQEREEFESKEPWLNEDKRYLGTDALVTALGTRLSSMINERLASISQKTNK